MPKTKRKFDLLSEERRQKVINEIIAYFKDERNEEIGLVAAENILDFFFKPLVKIFSIWQLLILKNCSSKNLKTYKLIWIY